MTNNSSNDIASEPHSAELLRIAVTEDWGLLVEFSPWLTILLAAVIFAIWKLRQKLRKFDLVQLEIPLGGIGNVTLKPNLVDIQIAHKIWTELVTRKAAIKIEPENDVIIEVYDSWYMLFQRISGSLMREIHVANSNVRC